MALSHSTPSRQSLGEWSANIPFPKVSSFPSTTVLFLLFTIQLILSCFLVVNGSSTLSFLDDKLLSFLWYYLYHSLVSYVSYFHLHPSPTNESDNFFISPIPLFSSSVLSRSSDNVTEPIPILHQSTSKKIFIYKYSLILLVLILPINEFPTTPSLSILNIKL